MNKRPQWQRGGIAAMLLVILLCVLLPRYHGLWQARTNADVGRGASLAANKTSIGIGDTTDGDGSDTTGVATSSAPAGILLRSMRLKTQEQMAQQRQLRSRVPPPKEPLRIPPGNDLRILVKMSDDLEARASDAGDLVVWKDSAQDLHTLEALSREWQLRWRKVQTADEEKLQKLEQRAAENTGVAQPDLGGLLEVVLPASNPEKSAKVAAALHALSSVEYAELYSADVRPPPPATDIAPTTPDLMALQTYRSSNSGIGVDYVWNTLGIRGHASLRVTDCEYMFNPDHEDLQSLVTLQSNVQSMYASFGSNHGTAVTGILFAGNNGYGMSGSIPESQGFFYPEISSLANGAIQNRPATVTKAVADSSPGDIVMLEMQVGATSSTDYVPAEFDLSVWNAVKTATDAGIVVVAAAGNGAKNLDAAAFTSYRNRGDSGAIIVGAADASRARSSFSTYGSRVNLQGWGEGVASLGYGTYAKYGNDPNQQYTATFNGTSSATPIVTSAVALLQSVAITNGGTRLTPQEIRLLLISTGKPQTGDLGTPIGNLPSLVDAIKGLSVPIVILEPPQGTMLAAGKPATISVKAGSRYPMSYQWKKNGKSISGATSANYRIDSASEADAGVYSVVVSVPNASLTSDPALLPFTDAQGRPLSIEPLHMIPRGEGTVTAGLDGKQLLVGAEFTVTAKPAAGKIFKEWLKNGVSASRDAKWTFTMEEGLVLEPVFIANPFPPLAHTFNGTIGEGNLGTGSPEDRQAFFSGNGFLTLTTRADGRFTGSLRLEGQKLAVSGKFDGFGEASLTLKRGGRSDVVLDLALDLAAPGEITGVLSTGVSPMTFQALPGIYHSSPPDLHPLHGQRFTILLPAPDAAFGHGYATLEIGGDGTATCSGKLADDTAFTMTSQTVNDGGENWTIPICVPLYSGSDGMLFGEVLVPKIPPSASADVVGTLGWCRPAIFRATQFPGGFLKPLAPVGERFVLQKNIAFVSSRQWLLALDPLKTVFPVTVSQPGVWPDSNRPVLVAPVSSKLTFSFTTKSGIFSGKFMRIEGEKSLSTSYQGIMLANPVVIPGVVAPVRGGGYFSAGADSGAVEVTIPAE